MEFARLYCEILSLLIVLISGGVRLTVSVPQGPYDAVAEIGEDVTFTYSNDAMKSTDYYYWCKYNPTMVNINTNGIAQPTNPAKYSFTNNGSYTLAIIGVTLQDAVTYCFYSQADKTESCANLILIDSLMPLVNPSNGVSIGQQANLTCMLQYGGPTKLSSPKGLSADQDPQLDMFIGSTQITAMPGTQVVGTSGMMNSKAISVNRTILNTDARQEFGCRVRTLNPKYELTSMTPLFVKYPTTLVNVDFGNKTNNNGSKTCCRVKDMLNCTADGFPFPNITWKDEHGQMMRPNRTGNGFASVQLMKQGKFSWNCSARNDLSTASATYITAINTNDVDTGNMLSSSISVNGVSSIYTLTCLIIMVLFSKMFCA